MHALGSMAMTALSDGIRESRMSAPATGFAPIPSRCAAPPTRNFLTQSRNSLTESWNSLAESRNFLTQSRNSLTESRNSLTESRNSLTESRNSLAESRNSLAESRNYFKKFRNFFAEFPKNHPHLSNFWPFSPLKPVFFRFWRLLRHFPGISPLAGLSPSPPLKEERVGVRRPMLAVRKNPSPQPSPRLGGERESKPPSFGNLVKGTIPRFPGEWFAGN